MAESNASLGHSAQGIHSPLPTGQSIGRFRDPISMEEPSRNYVLQIHFDVEAPGVSSGVNSVEGLAEAEHLQVPVDRRVSIVVPEDLSADSRGGNLPRAQSTRFPLSLQRSLNTSELRENSMDLTGTTHISNSFVPNARSEPTPAGGPGNAASNQPASLRVPNAQVRNGGTATVAPSGSFVAEAICVPVVSAPSSSFSRSEPKDYMRPVSESERLLCPRTSQPYMGSNNPPIGRVNQLGSQYNSVSSSHSLPGFSQSCQSEIRNEPVYSQSNMPRMESHPMLSHMPLPSVNLSNGPFMSSSSFQQGPGYFPQYSSVMHQIPGYTAPNQPNVTSSTQFPHLAQGSYSMRPPGPTMYGPSFIPVAPSHVAPPRQHVPGRIDFSAPT